MTSAQLEERLRALEQRVALLQTQLTRSLPSKRWWIDHAGRFKDDPVFDEIASLGREYRESLSSHHGDEGDSQ